MWTSGQLRPEGVKIGRSFLSQDIDIQTCENTKAEQKTLSIYDGNKEA